MDGYRHPILGFIQPLAATIRPRKVWKHLYAPEEAWRAIVPAMPEDVASRAEALLGVRRADSRDLPFVSAERWAPLRATLDGHHESLYGPAYMADLRSTDTEWAPAAHSSGRECGLSTRAVYLVVSTGPYGHVVTAYRPHPPESAVYLSEVRLRRYAQHFFERKTMRRSDTAQRVAEDLASLSQHVPATPEEVWALATAIGYARTLKAQSEPLRSLLGEAEARLTAVPHAAVDALAKGLSWTATLDELAECLKEEDVEEVDSALLRAEDLVIVAPVLGATGRTEAFLRELGDLVDWAPPSLACLVQTAGARASVFREEAAARELWSRVAVSVAAACLRTEAPTIRRSEAKLVDGILRPEAVWVPWLRLLAGLPARAGQMVAALDEAIRGLTADPVVVMGDAAQKDAWGVRERGPIPDHARMFVIAPDSPEGDEVELGHDVDLWLLDRPGDRALVVLVAGETPVGGGSLREVLDEAQRRGDVAVGTREISRPT